MGMHRWPLALVLLVTAAPTLVGCGVGGPPERPCAEDGFATFGSDPALPTCGTGSRYEARNRGLFAFVSTSLPKAGPYGSSDRRYGLGLSLTEFDRPSQTGGVEIRRDVDDTSIGDPTTLRAWGECTASALRPRLLVACDIEFFNGGGTTLTLDLPALPDPAMDPGLASP